MKAGRLKNEPTKRRDQVETALAVLATSLIELDEVRLRNEQAMRRTGIVGDVLEPAVERIGEIRRKIIIAQRAISDVWEEGQIRRWKKEED